MEEWLKWLLLFGVGCGAGFINVMAGGGSTITMPILIFLGLDSALANGTNRVAIFIQNISAITSFQREVLYNVKSILKYAVWTLPGAILGALFAVSVEHALFEKILAVVIVGVMITIILPQPKQKKQRSMPQWLIYPALLGIGFYGGFIQAGVGFMFMAAFIHVLGFDLVRVNRYKVFIILIYTIPALLVFAFSGNINIPYALALAAGNATGGWWSAKLTIKRGESIIRMVLMVVMVLMALKLLDIF